MPINVGHQSGRTTFFQLLARKLLLILKATPNLIFPKADTRKTTTDSEATTQLDLFWG